MYINHLKRGEGREESKRGEGKEEWKREGRACPHLLDAQLGSDSTPGGETGYCTSYPAECKQATENPTFKSQQQRPRRKKN